MATFHANWTPTVAVPNPEEKARRAIDRQLDQTGWIVQDPDEMNISAGPGVAVREFPLTTGEADYLLYAGGKAIGIVEAKPEGAREGAGELSSSSALWRTPPAFSMSIK